MRSLPSTIKIQITLDSAITRKGDDNMTKTRFEILLRRKNKVLISPAYWRSTDGTTLISTVATVMKNIESLGFTFSKELTNVLSRYCPQNTVYDIYMELVPILKEMVGANVKYEPMYPNFPESVMNRSDMELYLNAMIHYWSNGTLYPVEEKDERLPLFDDTKATVLGIGRDSDLQEILDNLLASTTSLSQTDKEDLEFLFTTLKVKLPEEIPFKETCALVSKIIINKGVLADMGALRRYNRTATDVLRLITALSDGDVSLATNTKYKSFKRITRRLLIDLLDNCTNLEEDMLKYKNRWIRVGERLHPSEYPEYKRANEAFKKLRENEKIETFNSKVEKYLEAGSSVVAAKILGNRPGEFARRLDQLLRKPHNPEAQLTIVDSFENVVDQVSTPVLLQVITHFQYRNDPTSNRVYFPKGVVAKCYYEPNTLEHINDVLCLKVMDVCRSELMRRFKDLPAMGNVYLSDSFKNYLVPFSQRSASKALKTIVRGSRLPILENIKTLRGFIWWTNVGKTDDCRHGRVDIDLSAAIFDENWEYMEHVSYTNLKSAKYQASHSGDITNGGDVNGDGVAEFVDIDIDSVVKYGARYVVYQVHSFTNQQFSSMEHAMFGWMGRENPKSGEIFEPKTVQQKMDLTTEAAICVPVIFDCVKREMIWCDMAISLGAASKKPNNIESHLNRSTAIMYSLTTMHKPNLYDLLTLHINARGSRVFNKEEADIIFDIDDGITPFDTDVFMGQYLV